MNKLLFIVACLSLIPGAIWPAKSQEAKTPGQQRPEFEVASVRPSGPTGFIGCETYPGGRVVIGHSTLQMLITYAFDVAPFQVSGGPSWVRDFQYRYDIEARPPSTSEASKLNPSTPKAPLDQEQREMLQALLIDRFQLQVHRESRRGPVYYLTLRKGPLKLEEVKNEGEFEWVGSLQGAGINGDGLAGKNISMPVVAQRLSPYMRKPVIDQTGLKDFFDFRIEYASDGARPDITSCILTSLEGIGLKLKPAQGTVEALIIDHAEKPSAN